MKSARLTLCLLVLVSLIAEAKNEAKDRVLVQLPIHASPQNVKEVTKRILEREEFSVSSSDASGTVFVKQMTGRARTLNYLLLSSSGACNAMVPRLFLTLTLTAKGETTVATVFAQVEHTALIERVVETFWGDTRIDSTCQIIRDPPRFLKMRSRLRNLLQQIKTGAEPPDIRPTLQQPRTGPNRWPVMLGF